MAVPKSDRCWFTGCKNRRTHGVHSFSLFSFPVKDKKRCLEWIRNSKNESFLELTEKTLKRKKICEHHFNIEDFVNSSKSRLLWTAVPKEIENCTKSDSEQTLTNREEDKNRAMQKGLSVKELSSGGLLSPVIQDVTRTEQSVLGRNAHPPACSGGHVAALSGSTYCPTPSGSAVHEEKPFRHDPVECEEMHGSMGPDGLPLEDVLHPPIEHVSVQEGDFKLEFEADAEDTLSSGHTISKPAGAVKAEPQVDMSELDGASSLTSDDEHDSFGRVVAAKLRHMSAKQRLVAEKLIHDVLFQGQLGALQPVTALAPLRTGY
ncbi:uncharacterized protein LOC134535445 isoform X2 [Bacillus rossius redtenbacheri]|uniref:uncharacterized protein LOC134535445 isoform X2 n=1 Tax=Bacillus rossius redtenbacheri TaxID=93214 RepID=UPI002FDEC48C